jgi:hypothetical protein
LSFPYPAAQKIDEARALEQRSAMLRFMGVRIWQEEAMGRYDIRLRKKGGAAVLTYCTAKESDAAAIRVARAVMEDGDTVEVWKGMRCIYADERALSLARRFAA